MGEFGFETPAWLLLLPVAILAAVLLGRRRLPAMRFSDVTAFPAVPTLFARMAKWLPILGRGAILSLLILAAANPRVPDQKTRLPVSGIAIILILDVSGSMNSPDFDPNAAPSISRLEAAKKTFALFAEGGEIDGVKFTGRTNDQIGLITFAAVPETACPLTLNRSVLGKVIAELQPKTGLDAGTNIGDSLGLALASFEPMERNGDRRRKVAVLLSDGEHNKETEATLRPLPAAQIAAKLGIPIYTIDCGGDGTTGGADEQLQRKEGKLVLATVADLTGAKSFLANDPRELREAFEAINRLERVPVESFRYLRYWNWGFGCGLAAFVLFVGLALFERTLGSRWPG